MIRVLFICHGNICRSPMVQMIFTHKVAAAGKEKQFRIDSAAVSREELGHGIYPPARRELERRGIPLVPHRARQVEAEEYGDWDLFICMDRSNLMWLKRIFPQDPEHKVHLLMDYTSRPGEVSDPWYTDRFDIAYNDIEEGCEMLMQSLSAK